jgi:hypothetical protein
MGHEDGQILREVKTDGKIAVPYFKKPSQYSLRRIKEDDEKPQSV